MRSVVFGGLLFLVVFVAVLSGLRFITPAAGPADQPVVATEPKPLFIEVAPEEIAAEPRTYQEALALAKKTGRKLVVMFSSSSCPPCRQMKATTLQDPTIKKLLKDEFVFFLALDDAETAEKFGILWVPTYHVIDPNTEQVLSKTSGFKSVAEFKEFLGKPQPDPVP